MQRADSQAEPKLGREEPRRSRKYCSTGRRYSTPEASIIAYSAEWRERLLDLWRLFPRRSVLERTQRCYFTSPSGIRRNHGYVWKSASFDQHAARTSQVAEGLREETELCSLFPVFDTSPEAARIQADVHRQRGPVRRFRAACQMSDAFRRVALQRNPQPAPEYSELDFRNELIWELYGVRVER